MTTKSKWFTKVLIFLGEILGIAIAVLVSIGLLRKKDKEVVDYKKVNKEVDSIINSEKAMKEKRDSIIAKFGRKVVPIALILSIGTSYADYVRTIEGERYDFTTITNYCLYLEEYNYALESQIKTNSIKAMTIKTQIRTIINVQKEDKDKRIKEIVLFSGLSVVLGYLGGLITGVALSR